MKIAMKLLAAAGAAALVIVASPAMAAAPYTVSAGSQTTGTAAIDGATDDIIFYTEFVEMGCDSGSATDDANLGTNSTGLGVANIDDTAWNGCLGPLNIPMTVDQVGIWNLNVQGDNVGGVIAGTISNVEARIASATPGQCEFTVTGQVGGSFNENTQQLTVDDTSPDTDLVVRDVRGCFGLVLADDPAFFAATYDMTNSPDGGLAIASS